MFCSICLTAPFGFLFFLFFFLIFFLKYVYLICMQSHIPQRTSPLASSVWHLRGLNQEKIFLIWMHPPPPPLSPKTKKSRKFSFLYVHTRFFFFFYYIYLIFFCKARFSFRHRYSPWGTCTYMIDTSGYGVLYIYINCNLLINIFCMSEIGIF